MSRLHPAFAVLYLLNAFLSIPFRLLFHLEYFCTCKVELSFNSCIFV